MFEFNLHHSYRNFKFATGKVQLPSEGIISVFGASGCGKTTLLKTLSGLVKAQGQVIFKNQLWQSNSFFLPVHKRRIGMVFQDGALFPHLNVSGNLHYARIRSGLSQSQYNRWLELLQLRDIEKQPVQTLSGGQKQRVGIARAILSNPQILMLDEPMSALDWRAKNELIPLIKKVAEEVKLPVLLITHSPEEVERLADNVLHLNNGSVECLETLSQTLSRFDSPLFDEQGAVSVLNGSLGKVVDGLQQVLLDESSVPKIIMVKPLFKKINAKVRIRVLARDVSLALSNHQDLSIVNQVEVKIEELIEQSDSSILARVFINDGQHLFAEITKQSANRLKMQKGMVVYALIKSVALAE